MAEGSRVTDLKAHQENVQRQQEAMHRQLDDQH